MGQFSARDNFRDLLTAALESAATKESRCAPERGLRVNTLGRPILALERTVELDFESGISTRKAGEMNK